MAIFLGVTQRYTAYFHRSPSGVKVQLLYSAVINNLPIEIRDIMTTLNEHSMIFGILRLSFKILMYIAIVKKILQAYFSEGSIREFIISGCDGCVQVCKWG